MSPASPIVFVVDDDISVREALEGLIQAEGYSVRTFASADAFLSHARGSAPSCLILDVNLPDLNGLDLQERIADGRGALPIIFITGFGDVPMTVKAMKAGAIEFLTKPFSDSALLSAIHDAVERSRAVLQNDAALHDLRGRFAALSGREREVMEMVVLGLMNKQVGGKLGISEITVKAHRGRVMQKMGARSLADLVRIAGLLGLSTGSSNKPT
jgi:FixJ family two-component response regulator